MKKLFAILCIPFLLGAKSENYQLVAPCYKADIIFVIDYSGSMSNTIPYYEPWLRTTAGELPLSSSLKAGLLFFSADVCQFTCHLTDDKILLDEKILQGKNCNSSGTYIEPALSRANEMFDISEKERGEKVPRIVVLVTDLDVSDPVESCEFIYSNMTDVFFILMEMDAATDACRIEDLKNCMLHNGIYFDGFVWVYEDLLKQFDPCM
jgi:hypothetical protein